jgi:hypothetical protein
MGLDARRLVYKNKTVSKMDLCIVYREPAKYDANKD